MSEYLLLFFDTDVMLLLESDVTDLVVIVMAQLEMVGYQTRIPATAASQMTTVSE